MAEAASNQNRRFAGKVAIVTGAGRGIGRAEAMLLAAQGAKVVVNDVGSEPLGGGHDTSIAQKVVEEIRAAGGDAVASTDSVADMEGGERMVAAAIKNFGRLDILINNAGVVRPRIIYNMSEEDWDTILDVNLKGHFVPIRFASPIFREQKSGVIVNTASESGLGHLGQASYSASKEGVVGLTRTVARDLARYGVRCNAIRPRAYTRLANDESLEAMLRSEQLLGRPAIGENWADPRAFRESRPEHVAALAVWLCSDAAREVNGRTFVAGGDEIGLYPEPVPVKSIFHRGGWDLDSLDEYASRSLIAGLRNDLAGVKK